MHTKKFNIIRAKAIIDENKQREEKIDSILTNQISREYIFKHDPYLISDEPIILVMNNKNTDDYYRTLIESSVNLNGIVSDVIGSDVTKDNSDMNVELLKGLQNISKVMCHIIHSSSWKNNKLSSSDKKAINNLIDKLKID